MINCIKHKDVRAPGLCPICLVEERDRYRRELEYRVIRSMAKSHLWVCLVCDEKDETWQEIVHGPDCIFYDPDQAG